MTLEERNYNICNELTVGDLFLNTNSNNSSQNGTNNNNSSSSTNIAYNNSISNPHYGNLPFQYKNIVALNPRSKHMKVNISR